MSKTRIKTKRLSSRRWLERHMDDEYVKKAKRDGYRSRAAYKFLEINEAHSICNPYDFVIDLGAAPGGWSQVISKVTKAYDDPTFENKQTMPVVALDLLEIEPIPGVIFKQCDFLKDEALDFIQATLEQFSKPNINLIVSDMAMNTTGHQQTDHLRTQMLAEASAEFALEALSKDGHFITKVFQGGSTPDLLQSLRMNFKKVIHFKPKSSRKESPELYVIAKNRK